MQLSHVDPHNEQPNVPARVLYLEPVESSTSSLRQIALADVIHALKRFWWLILLLGIVGAVAGALIAVSQEPTYQSKTTIQIMPHSEQPTVVRLDDSDAATVGPSPDSFLQAEVRILESRSLRNAVTDKLRAERKPWVFVPPDLFGVHPPKFLAHNAKRVKKSASYVLPRVGMSVKLFDNAGVIEITTTSPNPQFAAEYANETVRQYAEMQLSSASGVAEHNLAWMMRQLDNIKSKLETAESNLQAYGHAAGVSLLPNQASDESQKLSELEGELNHALEDRILKQSEYEIAKNNPVEDTPQGLDNHLVAVYQDRLADLRKQLDDLKRKYTPKYYKVAEVEAQIKTTEAALNSEREDILSASLNQYQIAVKRENFLTDEYATESKRVLDRTDTAVAYDLRKRETESLRQLYDELLKKVQGSVITSFRSDWIRVIDPAEPARAPFKPNPVRSVAMGSVACAFLGVTWVVGTVCFRRNLGAPGDTNRYLRVPELGVIPNVASLPRMGRHPPRSSLLLTPYPGYSTALSTWEHPMLAEAYRGMVASLMTARKAGGAPQVIIASSPNREDGKSMTVSHCGIALAEMGKKVLLIDADLRKPSLHVLLDAPNNWGLSNILSENNVLASMPVESLTRATHIPSLSVITSGPGIANVSSLLYSPRFDELIKRLRQEFDVIMIDVPPIFAVADARIIGRCADVAVLIIRAGRSTVQMALNAKQRLEEDGLEILGTVLNAWNGPAGSYTAYNYYYGDTST